MGALGAQGVKSRDTPKVSPKLGDTLNPPGTRQGATGAQGYLKVPRDALRVPLMLRDTLSIPTPCPCTCGCHPYPGDTV